MTSSLIYIIVAIILILSYIWYTNIITKRNQAREALSGIDVQLKKRSNLIPNVLTLAKRYMTHEQELLTNITALRSQFEKAYDANNPKAIQDHLDIVNKLNTQMEQFMINVENYPDLKANETIQQAMYSYENIEANISAARRFYNSAVTELNNSIEIFPGSIIAKIANVSSFPFYEAEESAKQPIDASQYL